MTQTTGVRSFDFHCHVDLFGDPAAEICRYERQQIFVLAMTTTPRAWRRNAMWTSGSKYVHAAVGLHPELMREREGELGLVTRIMEGTAFVGEVGLDGRREHRSTLGIQRAAFRSILSVANELGGRVVSIHSRGAVDAVLTEIEESTERTRVLPVLHWFSGSVAAAIRAVRLGCYFSVNGRTLEHERGRALVRALPMERVLTETDAPLASGRRRYGEWGEAALTVSRVAEVKGVAWAHMAGIIARNATRVCQFAGQDVEFKVLGEVGGAGKTA